MRVPAVTGWLLCLFACAIAAQAGEANVRKKAIAAIEAAGGRWLEDKQPSGRMVLRVDLSKPAADDNTVAIVARLPSLTYLSLANTRVTDRGLAHLAGATDLEALSLAKTAVTDAGLAALKPLKNMRTLILNGTSITDAGLKHLAAWPKLEALHLYGTKITAQGVEALKQNKSLRIMTIAETGIVLRDFKQHGPQSLTHLYVDTNQNGDAHRAGFYTRAANGRSEYDDFSAQVQVCPNDTPLSPEEGLKSLFEKAGCTVVDAGFDFGEYLVSLEVPRGCDPNFLERNIVHLTRLQQLTLEGQTISASFFADAFARNLVTLKFNDCKIAYGAFYRAEKFQKLQSLVLTQTKTSEELIFPVRDSPLVHLLLEDVKLTDESYQLMADHLADTLRHFEMKYATISDGGLKSLSACRELRVLRFSDVHLGSQGLQAIARLPQLETLELNFTPVKTGWLELLKDHRQLTDLCLSHTQIDDAGLAVFASLPNLRRLNLANTRISDAGLRKLDGCSHLEWIDVRDTDVTAVGTSRLQARLPTLEVVE